MTAPLGLTRQCAGVAAYSLGRLPRFERSSSAKFILHQAEKLASAHRYLETAVRLTPFQGSRPMTTKRGGVTIRDGRLQGERR